MTNRALTPETRAKLRRVRELLTEGQPDLSTWSWDDLMSLAALVFSVEQAAAKGTDLLNVKAAIAVANEVTTEMAKRPDWQPAPNRELLYRWIRDCAKAYQYGSDA